jgi:hypothetical protein
MSAEDRRRFVRLPSRLNASYKVIGAEPNRNLLTRNTSGGGIGFFTDSLLPAGAVGAQVYWMTALLKRAREFHV